MIEKDKERMDRPVPVNRNDYKAMYETLLACLIENGEPSHYLSYLEELYNSATRPAQPTVEEIMATLIQLKRGDCWCEKGLGNPMIKKHSRGCVFAQAIHDKLTAAREVENGQGE